MPTLKRNMIAELIMRTGITQKAAAKLLDVSEGQISKWKSGDLLSEEREDQIYELITDENKFSIIKNEHRKEWKTWLKQNSIEIELDTTVVLNDSISIDILESILEGLKTLGWNGDDLDAEDFEFRPNYDYITSYIENVIKAFLEHHFVIDQWVSKVFNEDKCTNDFTTGDLVDNIALISAASYHWEDFSLDADKITITKNQVQQDISTAISNYVDCIQGKCQPIKYDYYQLLDCNADALKQDLERMLEDEHANPLLKHLSYAEKMMLIAAQT